MSENPGEPLYEFLHSNGLESVYPKFGEKNIDLDLTHLIDIESTDLQKLCDELDLNIEQSIKFKKIVKTLNQNQNGNIIENSLSASVSSSSGNHLINNINDNLIDYKLKIVLAGDSATGKTSLIRRYLNNKFENDYVSTIGIDFGKKTILTPDNSYIQLQIWDTCGQERFDSVSSQYFRGAHCVIIVYDITQRNSFNCIENRWIEIINDNCNDNTYVVLVGNKLDKRIAKEKQQQQLVLLQEDNDNNNISKNKYNKHINNDREQIDSDSDDDMDIEYEHINGNNIENDEMKDELFTSIKNEDNIQNAENITSNISDNDNNDDDDKNNNNNGGNSGSSISSGRGMISSEEGLALAKKYNFQFCETSAKSGHHIPSLFLMCAVNALERKDALGLIHLKSQHLENVSNYSQNEGRPDFLLHDANNQRNQRKKQSLWDYCGCS